MRCGSFVANGIRHLQVFRDAIYPPIELLDGEKLVDMLEKLELGLSPVTTYDVAHNFFNEFQT